jgi:hypothetical protein
MRGNVRESHRFTQKRSQTFVSDLSYSGWQRRKQLKTDLREIFGAALFSTFFNSIDPMDIESDRRLTFVTSPDGSRLA